MVSHMKAWRYSVVHGKLEDSLVLSESVPAPENSALAVDQLLIQVISAALNPVDYKLPEAPVVGRIMIKRPATPGLDFAGRIVATHPNNKDFREGQLVFGGLSHSSQYGTLGQFIVAKSSECALLPTGVNPDDAASVGTAGTSALQALPTAIVKPGAKVFINGGSGGVGTWTVQFAKVLGAHIVTTCSTSNVSRCERLGADEVIDYTKVDLVEELKRRGDVYDLIVDNVGNNPALYSNSNILLKPGGSLIQVGVGAGLSFKGIFASAAKQMAQYLPGARGYHFIQMDNNSKSFLQIGQWLVEGKVRAHVDTSFGWEDVPAAFRKLREGHVKDKLVIRIPNESVIEE
ncbi:hypothetical protein jhhlp_006961 [Lomentospora prolificans]|uniref:Enoyl reductase (ER) domain-containing protein n=1 Tax=Lomentospora prolificans TaxID=41688 RepID=A0A2N3N1B2_9PEZI|nr:hypothetical protein jhhlp_006961 [Lomentospora prolificans]